MTGVEEGKRGDGRKGSAQGRFGDNGTVLYLVWLVYTFVKTSTPKFYCIKIERATPKTVKRKIKKKTP